MSEKPKFESFEDFWLFYCREHTNKTNRRLHFVGTSAGLACVAGAVLLRKPWLALAAPVFGYGGAWVGHFFVEKNRPASFKYPVWSFMADFKMYGMILRGKMDAEVERAHKAVADQAAAREANASEEPAHATN